MAENQVIPFMQGGMPAHVAALATESNIEPKSKVPQLSVRGKNFRIVLNGEERLIDKPDPDNEGERIPVTMLKLIILDQNKKRSRAYYDGGYDPEKPQPPICWSSDSVTPDPTVPQKQAEACASCPKSVKGSKITEQGRAVTACAMNKRLVIIPSHDVNHPALLLKLAITSVWDKDNAENEAKGFYAWDQYLDMLRQRGVTHTGQVVTKVRFDVRAEYPKLVFGAERWTTAAEVAAVRERKVKPEVTDLLNVPENILAAPRTPVDDDDEPFEQPAPPRVNAAASPSVTPTPKAPVKPATSPAPAPAPIAAAPEPAPADTDELPAPAPMAFDDEEGSITLPPPTPIKAAAPKAPKAPKAAPPAAKTGNNAGLQNLLDSWGN